MAEVAVLGLSSEPPGEILKAQLKDPDKSRPAATPPQPSHHSVILTDRE
jgi:hypothetical protein